jgi:hypothetical protein
MALGIVSDEEFEKDLIDAKVPIVPTVETEEPFPIIPVEEILSGEIVVPRLGRGVGNKETPEILRKLIGDESIGSRVDALALGESLGISPSSVSAYANAATSTATYNKPSEPLEDFLKQRKNRIIKKASAKMIAAIDGIDEAKLAEAPAGVLAGIAKSLSGVIKDLEPPVRDEKQTNVQFIMYAPKLQPENTFEVIHVSD